LPPPGLPIDLVWGSELRPRSERLVEPIMRIRGGQSLICKIVAYLKTGRFLTRRSHVCCSYIHNYLIWKKLLDFSCGLDSHRPLHFSLSGVSLRCPRTRLSLSPGSHSLDAATTIPLIECVDRPLGGVRFRWSHPSVIGPIRTTTDDRFRATEHLMSVSPTA
jgi:hypothetical protein